jgi:hypothetical protein
MNPNVIKKLQRNIDYHAAMAEYYQDKVDGKKKNGDSAKESPPSKEGSRKPTASAQPPQTDQDQVLAELHAGVVEQLMPILRAGAEPDAIATAQQSMPLRRNESADLKPAAGRFH